MKTKTYKTEKAASQKGTLAAVLKGLVLTTVLLFFFIINLVAQCTYPTTIAVQSSYVPSQGEYLAFKASVSITVDTVTILSGANVIFQAPTIIIKNPCTFSYNTTLKAQNACTVPAGSVYPDYLTTSLGAVCPGCEGLNSSILNVGLNTTGTPVWKWYKNALGDDSPPDLGIVIGTGPSIVVSPLTQTDYFVRDESVVGNPFAQIKIIMSLFCPN